MNQLSQDNTTAQGNRLIAEFDGLIPAINGMPDYDKHWELLMPVVDKINKTGFKIKISIGMADSSVVIRDAIKGDVEIKSLYWSTPLLATYNAVIDFITWYNTQTKTPNQKVNL